MYRLPDAREAFVLRQTEGEPTRLQSIADLKGRSGYVFAPFEGGPILIEGEALQASPSAPPLQRGGGALPVAPEQHATLPTLRGDRAAYGNDFRLFHDELLRGTFQKIVLARAAECDYNAMLGPDAEDSDAASLQALFWRACERFPHQYVAMVHTVATGTWLTATPELLLSHQGGQWQTMSLAGTMPLRRRDEPWDTKNRQEQLFVTDYIRDIVAPLATDLQLHGPYTAQAGNVVHLRTDVSFSLRGDVSPTELLLRLYPTPAVCGIEKERAREFILRHEHLQRRFYSGFQGPLHVGGMTQLFVTLRCMELLPDRCRLYAGSGLLPESTEEDEYRETTAKMAAMQSLLTIAP